MENRVLIGPAIAAALSRAREVEKRAPRTLRIRLHLVTDNGGGLQITARISAETDEELMVQEKKGRRLVSWDELDETADRLVEIVEEVAAEVLSSVQSLPRPTRQSGGGTLSEGLQREAALAELCAEKVVRAADRAINDPTVNLDAAAKAEAAMMAGLKLAALSAFAIGVKAAELVEELECELANLKQGIRDHPTFSMHRKLHS
ncbi:hypothetical protein [Chelativorans sp. AA-79]|uniref:hypothetical protein n=1 Tax=Chelativorans sp. AA-79 TaxID=3028735 RepID=UPI0023F6A72A|nr:hypothetical protein [Chelativorans sp. AA-79]WEX12204.1 hypothetical protein PVE73_26165 [Chelativorans sp. AA-79]